MNSLLLNTYRTIKNTFGKYITLFIIIFIGVGFFSGMLSITNVMEESVDKYYDKSEFFDHRIYSTIGFNKEDLDKIDNKFNVNGVKSIDLESSYDDINSIVRIESYNDNDINKLQLIEGRYPKENTNEIIVETSNGLIDTPKIGDTLKLASTLTNINNIILYEEYEVVGIATSPNYMSIEKGISNYKNLPLNSFIYMREENFILEDYTYLDIKNDELLKENSFSNEYDQLIEEDKEILLKNIELIKKEKVEIFESIGNETNISYMLTTRDEHYSSITYKNTISQMQAIGLIFPIFFFLVAGLVCYTTMSRMIDEERGQIGILRALGYTKISVSSKYFIYSLSATIIGGIIGAIFGIILFPTVIYNTWELVFNLPDISYNIPYFNMIIAIVMFMLVVISSTIISLSSESKKVPSELLRPKSPDTGKKVFLEKINIIWKNISFTSKITIRNILRYKKRFIMTILGIGGCTCLLVSGFGIRSSISEVSDKQFNQLTKYNGTIILNENYDLEEISKTDKNMSYISLTSYSLKINNGENEEVAYFQIYDKDEDMKKMNVVKDYKTKEELELQDNKILINQKLAELLNVKKDDKVEIEFNNLTKEFIIGGIYERYVNHEVYILNSTFEDAFNIQLNKNIVQFTTVENELNIQEKLQTLTFVEGVTLNSTSIESFENIINGINLVVIVIIISAATLAFVVLGNLATININERKREIATLKVLGFNHKETKDYIFKENMVLTLFGSLIGSILGIFAHNFIIMQVEIDIMLFIRIVTLNSILISIIVTFIFSIIVNKIMLIKIKNIDMIESLKSVE